MTDARKRHPVRIVASFLAPVVAVLALAAIVSDRINTNTELANQARKQATTACAAAKQQVDSVYAFLDGRITANGGPNEAAGHALIAAGEAKAVITYKACLVGKVAH